MTDTLALRGPDAEGIWKHRNALLGHRRLAVIDLSGGVQPMSYRFPTGQEVTLVYTGEVYNHDALRERLRRAGHEFRTCLLYTSRRCRRYPSGSPPRCRRTGAGVGKVRCFSAADGSLSACSDGRQQ